MKRKSLCRTLPLAMAAMMICGASAYAQNEKAFEAYDETVELTVGRGSNLAMLELPDGGSYEKNAVKDYAEQKLNVSITYEMEATKGEDYKRQLSLGIASGELPDIMLVYDIDTVKELVDNDLVADLTDVWEEYASDELKALYADSSEFRGEDILAKGTFDGKLMAIPRASVAEPESLIFIRQDWLDALGMTLDEDGDKLITREDLETVAKAFVENDPGKSGNPVGFALETGMSVVADNSPAIISSSFGCHYKYYFANEDGTVSCGSTNEAAKDALTWFADMYQKGLLDEQFGTRTYDDIIELAVNGQLGIVFGESSIPTWMINTVYEADPNAVFSVFALDDGTGKVSTAHYPVVNRWILVNKECENPEAIVKLQNIQDALGMHYDTLDDTNEMLDEYRSQGVIYNIDILGLVNGNPEVARLPYREYMAYKNGELAVEDMISDGARTLVEIMPQAEADYVSMSAADKAQYGYQYLVSEALCIIDDNDAWNWATPLTPVTTDTMRARQADLEKLEDQTWVKIITGKASVDEFDAFVEEYSSTGGDMILEEIAADLQ